MDEGLVWHGLFGGHAPELVEKPGRDADGDELLGIAGDRAADAAGTAAASAAELLGCGLGYVGKVNFAIRDMLRALDGSRGAR